MGHRYTVLGAGLQGTAIAYDLATFGEAGKVLLTDQDARIATAAARRVNQLTGKETVTAETCDASQPEALKKVIHGSQSVVSALPYFLNLTAAAAALAESAHFCDLGGNTDIVFREMELDEKAKEVGVSLLPDCGLAPGLANLLVARGVRKVKKVHSARTRCGGIPKTPRPPLFYKKVFSLEGLINEYSGEAICLRKGEIINIPGLTELEEIDVPGFGRLEAFVTTGGTSTAPHTFQGTLENFDYKTLRHPGHFAAMRAYCDLGLFRTEPTEIGGQKIVPRTLLMEMLDPLIDFPDDKDVVILTVETEGADGDRYRATLIDEGDTKTGFSAMERTTAFPTAAIAYLQAGGRVAPGATPIEKAVPLDNFFSELARRGLHVKETSE